MDSGDEMRSSHQRGGLGIQREMAEHERDSKPDSSGEPTPIDRRHPVLGEDGAPRKEVLQFPDRRDPMRPGPLDPARLAERRTYNPGHNPALDYQPPPQKMVLPPPNMATRLLIAVLGLVFLALLMLLMFHNWMTPGVRQPGGQKPQQSVPQKLP